LQHLVSIRREEDVADEEIPTEDSLHRNRQGADVGSLAKRRFQYILDSGVINLAFAALTIPVFIVGVISTNILIHNFLSVLFFSWQVLLGFFNLGVLQS